MNLLPSIGVPDVMIIDPPRAGMHQDVVDVILAAEPARIVYVSCNPATQARDIALLDCKYRVEECNRWICFLIRNMWKMLCLLYADNFLRQNTRN